MEEIPDLKVVVIGDAGVGKTSLMYRFVRDTFGPDILTSIGVDFLRKKVSIDEETYQLTVWDTAGCERYMQLSQVFYRSLSCVVLVFSVDNRDSFSNLDKWYEECVQYCTQVDIESMPLVLFGNKTDLKAVITLDEVKMWCDKHHNIPYIETSAKDGTGVLKGFELLTRRFHELTTEQKNVLKTVKMTNNAENEQNTSSDWVCQC